MALRPPALDLVAAFRRDTERLTGADARLGVAVSGGPDSLALLLLAAEAFPGAVEAATVDHGLRPESVAEAALVADICGRLGVPHAILTGDAPIAGNVQSGARSLRYRLLAGWAGERECDWILTAHHRDDQAETLLMRLNRGAGLSGLTGIRASARIADVGVARPLLGWQRATLAGIAEAAGIDPVQDPTNEDERYDRARLRRRIAGSDWIDSAALARSSEALAEAEAALEWTADRLVEERVDGVDGGVTLDPAGLPAELRRRLLLRMIALLAPGEGPPRGEAVQRLLGALDAGDTATLGGVKCSGGSVWRFVVAPPRTSP
ncbi:MAG TPA: tRNA lysidine(34) synthetase TilS [Allosphingosinicella sp.]|jgi:tRNA(Ile)-lysidine synthase